MSKRAFVSSQHAPIHAIRAWSDDEADERPYCGADVRNPYVAMNRTVKHGLVTCAACLRVMAGDVRDGGTRVVKAEGVS